jgi:hypothetical protein
MDVNVHGWAVGGVRQPRPEDPIRHCQTKPRGARAIQDRHLVPKRENFEVQSRARSSG